MSFPCGFTAGGERFKQHLSQTGGREEPQAPPCPLPHEYLAMNKVELPSLPKCNPVQPGVYPELPSFKSVSDDQGGPSRGHYARPGRRATEVAPRPPDSDSEVSPPPTPAPTTVAPAQPPVLMAPLAATTSTGSGSLVGLPNPRGGSTFRLLEDTFPKGPIGKVMRSRP